MIILFNEIAHLRVSAHCLIRRDGEIVQYVPLRHERGMLGFPSIKGERNAMIFRLVLS